MTARFKALLKNVDDQQEAEGWLDVSSAILDVTLEDQRKIEAELKKLASKVRAGKEKYMTLSIKNTAVESKTPLVFIVLPRDGDQKELFLQGLENAQHVADTEIVVGIGIDATDMSKACLGIALSSYQTESE